MVKDLSYNTIALVLDTWEALKRTKDYHEVAGSLLFQDLFEKSPETKILFGFPINIDPMSPDLVQSKRFKRHAVYLIQMLDTALGLLGPDIEILTEILQDLGAKHRRYGVTPEMYGIMGDSLLAVLKKILGPECFNEAAREAWIDTYCEMSKDMILAQQVGSKE